MDLQLPGRPQPFRAVLDDVLLAWVASPGHSERAALDVPQAVRAALEHPVSCPPLPEIVRQRKAHGLRTAILVDDATRLTPQSLVLPAVLDKLNEAGVPDSDITAIVALGTHRPMSYAEMELRFGARVLSRIRVKNHAFDNPSGLVRLGSTPSGVPVTVNREFFEADIKLGIGNIVPHLFAGWSGGSKIVQPGVSGADTTGATHMLSAPVWPRVLGKIDNPIRRELEDVGRLAGLDLVVNTVLDASGRAVAVVAGQPMAALREGAATARRFLTFAPTVRPDIVVAGAYPADRDLWQGVKPIAHAVMAVRPQGTVILAGSFLEGVSREHPTFWRLGDTPPDKVQEMVRNGDVEDAIAAAVHIALGVARSMARIVVVARGISPAELAHLGLSSAPTLQEAIAREVRGEASARTVGVMTHGGEMLPLAS